MYTPVCSCEGTASPYYNVIVVVWYAMREWYFIRLFTG